jgi:hypothetical protein
MLAETIVALFPSNLRLFVGVGEKVIVLLVKSVL